MLFLSEAIGGYNSVGLILEEKREKQALVLPLRNLQESVFVPLIVSGESIMSVVNLGHRFIEGGTYVR